MLGHPRSGQLTFGVLRGVEALVITNGRMTLRDLQQGCMMRGHFGQAKESFLPFHLVADGTLRGATFTLTGSGGPLNGRAVRRPYPFSARAADGLTIIDARGTSGEPFDFKTYDLAVALRGPDLADLSYLFNLQTPNSAPFALKTRALARGPKVRFEGLKGVIGASDISGSIQSDQSSPRHRVIADLRFGHWTKRDIEAALADLPPHLQTRATSGVSAIGRPSRWLLSDAPFPITRLRAVDIESRIEVAALEGFAAPLTDVRAHVALDRGRLTFSQARTRIYGGVLSGGITVDARASVPRLSVQASLRGVKLGAARSLAARGLLGTVNARFSFAGRGASLHAAAARSSGLVSLQFEHGLMPRPAAFLLGGDLLRAAGSLGDTRRAVPITCATATYSGSAGRFQAHDLVIQTPAGLTAGNGKINLATERVFMILNGHPIKRRLFQLAMPVKLEGPIQRPTASLMPGQNARRLGVGGKLGIFLSPVAALLPLGADTTSRSTCSKA